MPPAAKTTEKAKATASDKETPKKDKVVLDPMAQMAAYLKKTSDDHYNLRPTVAPFRVSSGSLNLDMEMGGFSEGAHRVLGGPNLGKTPFTLNAVDNFLDQVPERLDLRVVDLDPLATSYATLAQSHEPNWVW